MWHGNFTHWNTSTVLEGPLVRVMSLLNAGDQMTSAVSDDTPKTTTNKQKNNNTHTQATSVKDHKKSTFNNICIH